MQNTYKYPLYKIIIYLMLLLIPIDMLNGILLTNNIILPVSVAQLLKILLLGLIFFRSFFFPKDFFIYLSCSLLLFFPSILQAFSQRDFSFLPNDFIKISRYLTPLLGFLFFRSYIKNGHSIKRILYLVFFSYFLLCFNILLKHIGLGYPMYSSGNIGSKGYFYAGNEVSALLLILSSIIGVYSFNKSKFLYFCYGIFSIITALTIGSKTSMLGILLIFIIIPLKKPTLKRIDIKNLSTFFLLFFSIIPLTAILIWKYIKTTQLFNRMNYFYEKFDFLTFILSNRNVFYKNALKNYQEKYTFSEKIIGVGDYTYTKINYGIITEIDTIDVFFSYGYTGLIILILLLSYIGIQAYLFSIQIKKFPLANFVGLMLILLFMVSSTAGHVFSSGMAGIFIGLLFSLMYIKKK